MNGQQAPKAPRVAAHWPFPAGPMAPIPVEVVAAGPPIPLRKIVLEPGRPPAMAVARNLLGLAIIAAVAVVVLGLVTFGVSALWMAVAEHYP